ncbi:DnaJ, mitochondrial [Guillardia theta CCMP2712]|uniref:DnaJ, mitochondrial n=1 Tax=Guillardia theta (strain CCMP2712) TaxID=905079 RepID=L1JFS8_GUITC|nr:DnaJ, mitochondrial [Guillardia theta CCMP2712]EKX46999.1 DnaJ, mitochondrial [Guillardia theta CCMP2712]|eukprot:XP_005833979.1 DnaJ, mitochondrial [Guillardia theta CCMP2712]
MWPFGAVRAWSMVHGRCLSAVAQENRKVVEELKVKKHASPHSNETSCATPCSTGCPVVLAQELNCWNCGMSRNHGRCAEHMFCGSCGAMQPPAPDCNYFELLGIAEETFDIDVRVLEQQYKQLMIQLHPDKYMQKSLREQELSAAQSSVVNIAYGTLRCPHARAVYMLRRLGHNFDEHTSESNPEFLMEVMEVCSEIDENARNQEKLCKIRDGFYKPTMDTLCREATAAFAKRDVEAALVTTSKLQYLKRMKQMLHHSIDVE